EGRQKADRPIVDYLMVRGVDRIADAFEGVLQNLPARWAALAVRLIAFPFGIAHRVPSDRLTNKVAETLMTPSQQRDRLTPGLYLGEGHAHHALKDLEHAFALVADVEPLERKMRDAKLRDPKDALDKGVIDET